MNQAVNTNLNNNRIKGILLLLAFSTSYLHRLCNVARVEHKRKQNVMPCYGHVASMSNNMEQVKDRLIRYQTCSTTANLLLPAFL